MKDLWSTVVNWKYAQYARASSHFNLARVSMCLHCKICIHVYISEIYEMDVLRVLSSPFFFGLSLSFFFLFYGIKEWNKRKKKIFNFVALEKTKVTVVGWSNLPSDVHGLTWRAIHAVLEVGAWQAYISCAVQPWDRVTEWSRWLVGVLQNNAKSLKDYTLAVRLLQNKVTQRRSPKVGVCTAKPMVCSLRQIYIFSLRKL